MHGVLQFHHSLLYRPCPSYWGGLILSQLGGPLGGPGVPPHWPGLPQRAGGPWGDLAWRGGRSM